MVLVPIFLFVHDVEHLFMFHWPYSLFICGSLRSGESEHGLGEGQELPGWLGGQQHSCLGGHPLLWREAGAAYSLVWFQEHLAMHLTSFRFELVIVWRIQIDEEGKVLPKLDLLTKVPLQGRDVLVISHYAQHRHLLISSGFIWQESKVKNFINVLFKSLFKIFLSIITQKAQARGIAPPRPS